MNLSTTFKGTLLIVIFGGTWLVPRFGWSITSIFFRLIVVSPNRRAAYANESSVILFMSLIECAMSALSSANRKSRKSSSVIFVLAVD